MLHSVPQSRTDVINATPTRVSSSSQIDYPLLQQYFHLPISEVAKELGVCATVLKKLCRKHGIPRWPYRKIKSLNKLITSLEETKTDNEEEEQQRQSELRSLRKRKQEIIDNPAIIGPTYSRVTPKNDGPNINNSATYSSRVGISNPENSLREKSVMAILQRQRKYSAPAVHLAPVPQWAKNFEQQQQQSRLYTRRSSNGSIRPHFTGRPSTPTNMQTSPSPSQQWKESTPPPNYNRSAPPRASCPAVLEGLTPQQLQTLQSIGEPSYSSNPYNPISSDYNQISEYSNEYPSNRTPPDNLPPPPNKNYDSSNNFQQRDQLPPFSDDRYQLPPYYPNHAYPPMYPDNVQYSHNVHSIYSDQSNEPTQYSPQLQGSQNTGDKLSIYPPSFSNDLDYQSNNTSFPF